MKCHTVLGIKESASTDEISKAYADKRQQLCESQEILTAEAYTNKLQELDQAKIDCYNWTTQSCSSRIGNRTLEANRKSTDVRLYTPCCGPLTCLDSCGAACMGSSSCYDTGCTGILYIDLCVMGIAGIFGLIKLKEKHDANMRVERRESANRARQENVHLNAQLGTCKQEEQSHRERIQGDQAVATKVDAFSSLFEAMGANPASDLVELQNRKIASVNEAIEKVKQREDGILNRIRENERIISEASHDA